MAATHSSRDGAPHSTAAGPHQLPTAAAHSLHCLLPSLLISSLARAWCAAAQHLCSGAGSGAVHVLLRLAAAALASAVPAGVLHPLPVLPALARCAGGGWHVAGVQVRASWRCGLYRQADVPCLALPGC